MPIRQPVIYAITKQSKTTTKFERNTPCVSVCVCWNGGWGGEILSTLEVNNPWNMDLLINTAFTIQNRRFHSIKFQSQRCTHSRTLTDAEREITALNAPRRDASVKIQWYLRARESSYVLLPICQRFHQCCL